MEESNDNSRLADLIAEAEAVEAAVQEAVEEALRAHKRAGNPVAGWHNDQLEWVPAELEHAPVPAFCGYVRGQGWLQWRTASCRKIQVQAW